MFRLTLLALAVTAAFGARAQGDDATATVTVGAGLVAGSGTDRARELDLRWRKPGDWSVSADVGQGVRDDPREPSTGADLTIKRTGAGVSYTKLLGPRLQLDFGLRSEKKEGARLWGIGFNCPSGAAPDCAAANGTEAAWAILSVPEPLDAVHSQVEARVSYAFDALRLTAGYHGSFYDNRLGALVPVVPASLNNPLGEPLPPSAGLATILGLPVALPPDNQAHQLDIAGTYAFSRTTRANFKLAYARARQDQDFAGAGLTGAPAGVTDLGARVNTTVAHLGLTARPLPRLSLSGTLRFEDRDDDTPLQPYNVEGAATYTNRHLSHTKWRAKAQAHWQFTSDVRGTLGADVETIDRGRFTATSAVSGITALRQKTDETTLRAELRRRMNEDFSGALSVSHATRHGSNWLRDNSGLGVTETPDPGDPATGFATGIFMPTLADRERDAVKLTGDWQPTEALQLQVSAQVGRDRYDTPSAYGLRSSGMGHVSLDAGYMLSEKWRIDGYASHGSERLRQSRPGGYIMAFDSTSTGVGLGLSGSPRAKVRAGAGVSYVHDRSEYDQALDPLADAGTAALLAATGGLPDIVFRQAAFRLFGSYEIDARSSIRIDLVHRRTTWTDWAWRFDGVPFAYSDGTTVDPSARRSETFAGVRYAFRWN
jgi:MtrB/PioB family decaheme-associated outer membrane protein